MIWIPAVLGSLGFVTLLAARGGAAVLSGVFALFVSIALLIAISGDGSGAALSAQAITVLILLSGLGQALVGHALVSDEEEKETKDSE